MDYPPFDRVIEVDRFRRIVVRTHKVFSVVKPKALYHRVWYWVVTTTGKVLEINGQGNFHSAIGVKPGENF